MSQHPHMAGTPGPDGAPGLMEERRQLLRFSISNALYGLPIDTVREILQVSGLTEVPMMPPFVRGVMNLRGAVVPVLDLAQRLGLGRTEIGRRTCIVIVDCPVPDGAPQRHGVLIDAVYEVLELGAHELVAVPTMGTRVAPQYLSGIARVKGQSMEMLEVARVFDEGDLARLVGEHCDAARWLH